MIDVDKLAEGLKIDKSKAFEVMPAVATNIEKAELIDIVSGFKKIGQMEGLKLVTRITSRMKLYHNEIDEVLSVMFNVPVAEMTSAQKFELIQKLITEKDLDELF